MTQHFCDICKKQVRSWKDLVLVNIDPREVKDIDLKEKARFEICPDCFKERVVLDKEN